MWFIWIMWVIVAIAIIATIILLTGKGSMLVSGFNTKSPEERAKYDKEKVSKQTGLLMTTIQRTKPSPSTKKKRLLSVTFFSDTRRVPVVRLLPKNLKT